MEKSKYYFSHTKQPINTLYYSMNYKQNRI